MAEGRHGAPNRRSGRSSHSERRALANEHRLLALGEAVDQRAGVRHKTRVPRPGRLRRNIIIAAISVVALVAALIGGGYVYAQWRFNQIPKINVANEYKPIGGEPFNILSIGSDSRVGLTGKAARQTGASTGAVTGQRSDVVKIIHVDPVHDSISILSIPRDTMVTLLSNQALYGSSNRINVNYADGPSLLAQTITANFGIRISHVVQVSFAGLINAADAIGGVYLDFPYESRDPYSGLVIQHPGCQLVTGFQALAVARSRHFYYSPHDVPWPKTVGNIDAQQGITPPGWVYDGTSDFGRIDRQDAFLRAMLSRMKHLYNPLTLNSFLSKIPQGITLDSNFTLNDLIGLAVKFHGYNPAAIKTYTLPTISAVDPRVGDVLFVAQPAAQQMLVNVFGSSLIAPTDPPPNTQGQTPMPPVVTTTTVRPGTVTASNRPASTAVPTNKAPSFDPVPCTP
jgi:LCP family protein required for cell wall assembly